MGNYPKGHGVEGIAQKIERDEANHATQHYHESFLPNVARDPSTRDDEYQRRHILYFEEINQDCGKEFHRANSRWPPKHPHNKGSEGADQIDDDRLFTRD